MNAMQRIEELEAEIESLKARLGRSWSDFLALGIAGVSLIIAFVALAAWREAIERPTPELPATPKLRGLEIVDDAGVTRAKFEVTPTGSHLMMSDPTGPPRLYLGTGPKPADACGLSVMYPDGSVGANVSVYGRTGLVSVGPSADDMLEVTHGESGPRIWTTGPKGGAFVKFESP